MRKKTTYGIISGAGPMAGALLYEKVIEKLQAKGAWQDHDFPSIILMNVPFSPMIDGQLDNQSVREELLNSLSYLSEHCDRIYIACQTLHLYLNEEEIKKFQVISLLQLTKEAIKAHQAPIKVIASKTSRLSNLHGKYVDNACEYVADKQAEDAIEAILKGQAIDMTWAENIAEKEALLLGCTEFSVALKDSKAVGIIDPIMLAAEDIIADYQWSPS
jgi:aspartate/glutamate racemase